MATSAKIGKNLSILHEYEFPLDLVLSIHRQMVSDMFDKSKHKAHLEEILHILDKGIERIKPLLPEKIPIISTILRNAYKYSTLIAKHPNYTSIKLIFIPELISTLKDIIDTYWIAKESGWEYTQECVNAVHHRFKVYQRKLELLTTSYNLNKDSKKDETLVIDIWDGFKSKPKKRGRKKK